MIDDLGDRMKMYERMEAGRAFMPLLPIVARIDGRSFSSFTRGMKRPFDKRLTDSMIATTNHLVDHTGATLGYTQSDEISLAWYSQDIKSQVWFNGKVSKMVSSLSAQATLFFYREIVRTMPEYADRLPTFDARVWQTPSLTEGANVFVWREWDATKNSIQMAARDNYSHKQLVDKNGSELQELLFQKGINWNDYPAAFKRGTYVQRRIVTTPFLPSELARLPPKHHARTNPDIGVSRSVVTVLDLPPITTVSNRGDFVFRGAEPVFGSIVDDLTLIE